ncbi:cytochrome c biogenesis protein ResB [Compostimonas suwonensis]|uniref:Cytochrome c biogenesis protein n=1 Tax=Compostimonas suwonensis TaxID=1048394 RepID=A0A2M9C3C3_9MICO|nr:cytochrome c biogenesis protein ResB [Compostimonas suwonensis]PJJ65025.1 cytochrome c biogenesis protein [Compostimonas suwonensis]
MSRPSDHIDSPDPARSGDDVNQPKLGVVGWLRWFWRQLTSMRTALFLLLLLAIAAVPGSLVPQRSSDPNGVTQYFADNPDLAPVLDKFQAFDVYGSVWFSAIYLLLFVSLIGCVIPRTKHHFQALRAKPPRTPVRLTRLEGYTERIVDDVTAADAIEEARGILKRSGYRVATFHNGPEMSVSAERGYLRETGNLVFHSALVGILLTVGVGGGFGFSGQRVLVEGQSFVNTIGDFDSFNPGRFFNEDELAPYSLTLDSFHVTYEQQNQDAFGQPTDFRADVTTLTPDGEPQPGVIKVNEPLRFAGTDVYLLGNGYAPTITVRDPAGTVVFTDSIPFLPQDANLTSIGVVKVPDGLAEQLGMIGLFYPTQGAQEEPFFSSYPDLEYPTLSLTVYEGDLGIDDGKPTSVYTLSTDDMTEIAGRTAGNGITLMPGQTAELPKGLGSVTFENASPDAAEGDFSHSVARFASLDIHHDPTQGWVLLFAVLILLGLLTSLFVPRRRVWVKAIEGDDGELRLEYAGLARGEDPALADAVTAIADRHEAQLGLRAETRTDAAKP